MEVIDPLLSTTSLSEALEGETGEAQVLLSRMSKRSRRQPTSYSFTSQCLSGKISSSLRKYARAIFTIPVVTVTIGALFWRMAGNKSSGRARLNDSTVANILHTQDLESAPDADGVCKKSFKLGFSKTLELKL